MSPRRLATGGAWALAAILLLAGCSSPPQAPQVREVPLSHDEARAWVRQERQIEDARSDLVAALIHAPHTDPQRARVVSTSRRGPPSSGRSSMTSKASSSAVPAATSGRYQPAGGALRRTRRTASKAPCRLRIRPMVRRLGSRR